MSLASYHDKVRDHIRDHGRSVTGVFPDPATGDPGFAYTIGNSIGGVVPELLIIGMWDQFATRLLNIVSDRIKDDQTPREISLGGEFPLRLRAIADPRLARRSFTIQAGVVLGTVDYAVMQLVVPDPAGHWPDDPDCDPRYRVPLL